MNRAVHGLALCLLCWYGMQAVHEAGHVAATYALGGQVEHLTLHPLAFSETGRSGSRSPQLDTWAGAVAGCLLPLLLWGVLRRWPRGVDYGRFFAGFCLLANGLYLGAGWLGGASAGDAADLVRLGTPAWLLVLFGAGTAGAGFWCLSPMGHLLGYAPGARVSRRQTVAVALLAVLFTLLGLLVGPRQ